jgi:chromosome segregation ATPase
LARLQAKLFLVEEARQAEKRAGEGRARDAAEVAAKRLARCKAKLVVYREERKKEKIQIEEIERSIEQRANQVVALKAQLKNQEAENEEQRKVLELRNQIAKQHTEAMRKMKSKNKSLANENEQLNEVVASLQREVQTLKASIEQLKQQQVAMPSVSTTAAAALEAKEIEFSQARIGILLFVKSIEVEENLRAFHSLFWNLLLSVETVRVKLGSSAWQRRTYHFP